MNRYLGLFIDVTHTLLLSAACQIFKASLQIVELCAILRALLLTCLQLNSLQCIGVEVGG